MDKREAMVVLTVLQANWSHIELSEMTLAVWCDHLRDIPPASGLIVANHLVSTSEHFPTVSEFRTAWRTYLRQQRDRGGPAIEEGSPSAREVGLAGIRLARVALADARPIQGKP